MIQAMPGPVKQIKYRQTRRELFVIGMDNLQGHLTVRIFDMATMQLKIETPPLHRVVCFDVSPTLTIFGVGCAAS